MSDYEFGILEGGPLDGHKISKGLLDLNVRYGDVPNPAGLDPKNLKFCKYERIKGTNRLKFVKCFDSDEEKAAWEKDHPQEFDYY